MLNKRSPSSCGTSIYLVPRTPCSDFAPSGQRVPSRQTDKFTSTIAAKDLCDVFSKAGHFSAGRCSACRAFMRGLASPESRSAEAGGRLCLGSRLYGFNDYRIHKAPMNSRTLVVALCEPAGRVMRKMRPEAVGFRVREQTDRTGGGFAPGELNTSLRLGWGTTRRSSVQSRIFFSAWGL